MALHGQGLTDSAEALADAWSNPGAVVVDIRSAEEIASNPNVPGHLHLEWDKSAEAMPLTGLPEDKSTPLLCH